MVKNKEVEKAIEFLQKKKFIYSGKIKAPIGEDNNNWIEREQLLFKSSDFGDDKDRALQKADKTWTYFASDIACLLYTSPSPRDVEESRMPSSA